MVIVALGIAIGLGWFVYMVCYVAAWRTRDVPPSLLLETFRNFNYGILIFVLLCIFVCYVLDDKVTLKKLSITSLILISVILVINEGLLPYTAHRAEEKWEKDHHSKFEVQDLLLPNSRYFKQGWRVMMTRDCVEIYVPAYSLDEYNIKRKMMNSVLYEEIKDKCLVEGDSIKFKF